MASVVLGALHAPSALSAAVRRWPLALTLVACVPGAGVAQATPSDPGVLGRWRGTSLCVKASWNATCRDEQVIYHFARAAEDSNRIALHAEKLVAGATVPMGDLELRFDEVAGSWVAQFPTARGHVLWSYRVEQGQLIGRLVEMPSGRLVRNVNAVRDST